MDPGHRNADSVFCMPSHRVLAAVVCVCWVLVRALVCRSFVSIHITAAIVVRSPLRPCHKHFHKSEHKCCCWMAIIIRHSSRNNWFRLRVRPSVRRFSFGQFYRWPFCCRPLETLNSLCFLSEKFAGWKKKQTRKCCVLRYIYIERNKFDGKNKE